MVGNSLKSDILPVISIGGFGVHVPFHTTWIHEKAEKPENHERVLELEHINELLNFLGL